MLDKEKQSPNQNKFGSGQTFLDKQFKNLRIMSIFLFPLVAFLAFRAQDILFFLFNEAFNAMVLPFQIIIWGLIFAYLNAMILRIALFMNKKGMALISFLILVFYAVVLNFCLIPSYGLEGIGIATLASLAAMFVFNLFYVTRIGIRVPLYKSCEKPVVATMGMMLILHYVDSFPFILVFLSGVLSYFLVLAVVITLDK